jgi:hypothetical protein
MKFMVALVICSLISGCASFNEYCRGAALGAAVGGVVNPLGAPCAVNDIIYISKGVGNMFSGSDTPPPHPKTFVTSSKLSEEISVDPQKMQFVLESQDKYKSQNFGAASDEQKKNMIGRYESPITTHPIIISDKGDRWQIAYEGDK